MPRFVYPEVELALDTGDDKLLILKAYVVKE